MLRFIPKRDHLLHETRDYIMISLGALLYAIGLICFQLPYNITNGGVSGVSTLVYYSIGVPVEYTFWAINIALLIVAVKILGWRFCIKTIYTVFLLGALFSLLRQLIQADDGTLPTPLADQSFMACMIAAALQGIGVAIVLLNNGSCGGTDIIAMIVNKYRDVTIGQIMMICDILIITSSYFLFQDPRLCLFGYTTLIVCSLMLDYVLDRARQSVQFLIISRKYEMLAKAINSTGRGVTVLDGHGYYTGEDRKVLIVLAKRRESTNLFRLINSIDPNAFVSQSKVVGVYGEGFDHIKVK